VNAAADDLIFLEPVPAARTAEEWDAIVERLVSTLGDALDLPLVIHRRDVISGVALSCQVKTGAPVAGPLEIGLTATIGFEVIQQRPVVNAFVFLFTGGTRLSARGVEESFAELLYEPGGRWRLHGWAADEYGEFSNRPPP
jgi:hypothetical protein